MIEFWYSQVIDIIPDPEDEIVIAAIYEYQFIRKEPLWFTKLAEILKNDMKPTKIIKSLNWLTQNGWFTQRYKETTKGHYTFESSYELWGRKIYKKLQEPSEPTDRAYP